MVESGGGIVVVTGYSIDLGGQVLGEVGVPKLEGTSDGDHL